MQFLNTRENRRSTPLRCSIASPFSTPAIARSALIAAALFVTATLAAAVTPTLSTSQYNDGTQVDTSVVGTRIPVVLVHGLGGSAEGWENFLRAYDQNPAWRRAFKPYSFQYSTTQAEVTADPAAPRSLTALGAALRDALQRFYDKPEAAPEFGFGNRRLIVLAHSMGGLVARSMMQEYAFRDGQRGGQKVLHLITLGTPHHGTQLADAGIMLGYQTLAELSGTYTGFLKDLTWTNYDRLDLSWGLCNPWLAALNNYAPSTGATYGRCGAIPANPLPGYYEKIIAYGANDLQDKDFDLGRIGVYKPGSDLESYWFPHELLLSLSPKYPNDGIVPFASSQFDGAVLWQRSEAFACDHRYIKNGYRETVRTATTTYADTAFCPAANDAPPYPSGTSGGYAVSGSILGAPGGIVETITTVAEAERVLNWAEQAYAGYLQPAGATSDIADGYYFRYYPATQSYAGVKNGNVYYKGPYSNNEIQFIATLADFLAKAQAAGF